MIPAISRTSSELIWAAAPTRIRQIIPMPISGTSPSNINFRAISRLEAGYAGLRGMHLAVRDANITRLIPSTSRSGPRSGTRYRIRSSDESPMVRSRCPRCRRGQLLSPYPQYLSLSAPADFSGDSTYHSLQVKAEKRFKSGGTLLGSYTFSKILSNAETLTTWLDSPNGCGRCSELVQLAGRKSAYPALILASGSSSATSMTFPSARAGCSYLVRQA